MDRMSRMDAAVALPKIDLPRPDQFLPSSREVMLDSCLDSLDRGPVLVTGDAGVGKSWFATQLIHRVGMVRWLTIDLTPNDGPSDFYRHLARELGLPRTATTRLDINDMLADRLTDGERIGLVIDEAQNLGLDVWEEVRVLLNRVGTEDGLSHLLLVGQTPLIRRFATRPMTSIEARLAAHVHLRAFDIAEARSWLTSHLPNMVWSMADFEAIHRDTAGNPRRLIRRALQLVSTTSKPNRPLAVEAQTMTTHSDDQFELRPELDPLPSPLIGPDRPPLHVADNSIEVGWSAEDSDPSSFGILPASDQAKSAAMPRFSVPREDSEQAVHDHYAALQAWREWASNQEKQLGSNQADRILADAIDDASATEAADSAEVAALNRGSLRTEGYQHFAPFGQLFTRMSPVREP